MPTTPNTAPLSPPPGQQDQSARLAASAEVGQEGGTIPQVYQDYMASMEVLWDMVMNAKDAREKHALMCGFAAIKSLLLDRGYDA